MHGMHIAVAASSRLIWSNGDAIRPLLGSTGGGARRAWCAHMYMYIHAGPPRCHGGPANGHHGGSLAAPWRPRLYPSSPLAVWLAPRGSRARCAHVRPPCPPCPPCPPVLPLLRRPLRRPFSEGENGLLLLRRVFEEEELLPSSPRTVYTVRGEEGRSSEWKLTPSLRSSPSVKTESTFHSEKTPRTPIGEYGGASALRRSASALLRFCAEETEGRGLKFFLLSSYTFQYSYLAMTFEMLPKQIDCINYL